MSVPESRRRRILEAPPEIRATCAILGEDPFLVEPLDAAALLHDAARDDGGRDGGAGEPEHFRDAFVIGASGALAATVFHDRLIAIPDLKEYLGSCGIEMRP